MDPRIEAVLAFHRANPIPSNAIVIQGSKPLQDHGDLTFAYGHLLQNGNVEAMGVGDVVSRDDGENCRRTVTLYRYLRG